VEQEPGCGRCYHTDADPKRVGVQKRAAGGHELAGARGGFGGLCQRASGPIFAGRLAP
jgi:hypothetical protein